MASVGLSFTKWNGLALGDIKPAGLQNYNYVVNDYPAFWPAVRHNILWLLFLGVIGTPLGLLIAVLLDQRLRGSKIYQTVFFIPVMLSLALVGIIWELMYSPSSGLIDNVLGTAGTKDAIDWLGDSNINIWAALVAATWKHVGYIMILYLAGLKGVDPSLREAAAIDGASERQAFFRVVFPAMRPINIVIVVITVIESLRAFDIVWVFNQRPQRAGTAQRADRPEPRRRGPGHRHRVRARGDLAGDLAGPDRPLPDPRLRQGQAMTTTLEKSPELGPIDQPEHHAHAVGPRPKRYGTHLFLIAMSVLWLLPLLWTLYVSLRPFADTNKHGYFSFTGDLSLDNYTSAWKQGGFAQALTNSAIIVIPTVLIVLFLASLMAFAVSRFSWKFNITLLIMFTAGNMLPPQVLATPVFEIYRLVKLPYSVSDSGSILDTYWGVIAIIAAFQLGFCTFVLSNYMKALPQDLTEAALVDGCGVWKMYWKIVLPLCRPALAALGTLEVIWVYNEYFWPLLLSPDTRPAAGDDRDQQPQRAVPRQLQPHRGRRDDHHHPHAGRLPRAAAPVRRRVDPRRQQGLTPRRTAPSTPKGA